LGYSYGSEWSSQAAGGSFYPVSSADSGFDELLSIFLGLTACAKTLGVRSVEGARLTLLAENSKIGGWGLEGAWLQPRLTPLFKDLRHGWEAVPLQNFSAREFFRSLFRPCRKGLKTA